MELYTSYFANWRKFPADMKLIAICLFPPTGFKGAVYKKVAPDKQAFFEYKEDGSIGIFFTRYEQKLTRLNPEEIIRDIKALVGDAQKVGLICFEKDNRLCHRYFLAKWLTAAGYKCTELGN